MATQNTLDKFKKLLFAHFDTLQIEEERKIALYTFRSLNNLTFERNPYEEARYYLDGKLIKRSIGAELEEWIMQEKSIREERKQEEVTLALLHSILKAYA